MASEKESFYPYSHRGEFSLVFSILMAIVYAGIVEFTGNEIGVGPVLFGIGTYAGIFTALRDGFTGPQA